MFKIFTFKTLAVISACICFLLIAGAFFNTFSPIIEASLTLSANVPIVMYHQIKDTTSNWGNYILPTHVLKEDFEYFKKAGITPVSFDDLDKNQTYYAEIYAGSFWKTRSKKPLVSSKTEL